MSIRIKRLRSGGLITNYNCPSRCAHCLYACGPTRERDYISGEAAFASLTIIRGMGCGSVHIGGGEPLINPTGLAEVLDAAREAGVAVEYVETNSAWFKDMDSATDILSGLRRSGLNALLVSMSPFHNAYIPFGRVEGVLAACGRVGIKVLPWVEGFRSELSSLDTSVPHSLAAQAEAFGPGWLAGIPGRYWLHMGGRAALTYAEVGLLTGTESLLAAGPCRELADTSHFHIDLFGNYIPGLCSGLVFDQNLLGRKVDGAGHPLLDVLYTKGVEGLAAHAAETAGFKPAPAYLNKCHLCLEARAFLFAHGRLTPDLGPKGFYEQLGWPLVIDNRDSEP